MKSGTQDQLTGKFHKGKGTLKEIVGILNDNPKLEGSGTDERISGIVQHKIGQVKLGLGK